MKGNLVIGQSGGPTAVIHSSVCGGRCATPKSKISTECFTAFKTYAHPLLGDALPPYETLAKRRIDKILPVYARWFMHVSGWLTANGLGGTSFVG